METEKIKKTDRGTSAQTNSFIPSAFKGKNSFWRYLSMVLIPFLVSNIVGYLILGIIVIIKSAKGELVLSGSWPDFTAMGFHQNFVFGILMIPFIMALVTFILMMKPVHSRSINTVINGGRRIRWDRMLISALVWLSISGLGLFMIIKDDPSNFVINNTSGSLITLALLSILLIPFQAAFEEILFRGYLMQGFAVLTKNRWMPILITSIFFGLMHSVNPEIDEYGFWTMMPQYVFFGLVFAVSSMLDDGIEIAIGAHAANNAFISVFVTTKASVLQTPALYMQITTYPWKDFAGSVISSLLFLIIMMLIFKWKNFRLLYERVRKPVVA